MAPPSKGYRRRLNLRVPLALYVAVSQAAAAAKMSVNDYACHVLEASTKERL